MRGVQHLAFRAKIMGILGLVCFESIAEKQGSLNEILGYPKPRMISIEDNGLSPMPC